MESEAAGVKNVSTNRRESSAKLPHGRARLRAEDDAPAGGRSEWVVGETSGSRAKLRLASSRDGRRPRLGAEEDPAEAVVSLEGDPRRRNRTSKIGGRVPKQAPHSRSIPEMKSPAWGAGRSNRRLEGEGEAGRPEIFSTQE